MNRIKDFCDSYGIGQSGLAKRFNIPLRTVQDWYSGRRVPPEYVADMIEELLAISCSKLPEDGRKPLEHMD